MTDTILTSCGEIKGTACQWPGIRAYKGIRYATAGRFEYPVQVTHWDGVYDATQYGHCSYQPRAFYNEEDMPKKIFYYNEFRRGETYTYSEDCLFLNIWTPENAGPDAKLPVIFYIHGGGFTGGCGHEKHFDGPVWPTKGVVAVTINYRLGPLGFACLKEAAERDGHTGNYGLYDQMTALTWVRDNITAFGGDPDNITIMGQSAGAMSVQQHSLSPLTDGLFHKAVMSSGAGVNKFLSAAPAENRYEFWKAVMQDAGCESFAQFCELPADKLFASWQKVQKEQKKGMVCSPCIDGVFLTESAVDTVAAGKQKNIPYMTGTTSHDMMPPILFSMAKDWTLTQNKQGKQPSYTWFFDRMLPGDNCGAWHSSDLWYWFGTLANGWRPFEEKDYAISDQMVSYLTNFAKTGNPNDGTLLTWEPVGQTQDKVLCIGEGDTRMGKPSKLKLTITMLTNKAVGE